MTLTLVAKERAVLTPERLAALAQDLAKAARPRKDVLADYGFTEDQYYELEQNPYFMHCLDDATRVWNGPKNTKQRCELGAQALLETVLPSISKGALDEKQPLNARTDAARLLAKIGGVGEKEASIDDSERVVITINLGEDQKLKYEQPVKPIPPSEPKTIEGFNVG